MIIIEINDIPKRESLNPIFPIHQKDLEINKIDVK